MRRIKKLKIASPNFTFYIFNFTFCHAASRMILSDRKSARLNSSHSQISYAVFCLKKKKLHQRQRGTRSVHFPTPCPRRYRDFLRACLRHTGLTTAVAFDLSLSDQIAGELSPSTT